MEIVGDSCGDAWEKSVAAVLRSSEAIRTTSAQGACLELMDIVVKTAGPVREPRVSPLYDFPGRVVNQLGSLRPHSTHGFETLHDRVYRWRGKGSAKIDQFSRARDLLRATPESRRAVISFWHPEYDSTKSFDICPIAATFNLRSGHLHMSSFTRSNDAWLAAPVDMFMFTELQRQMAEETATTIGTYSHHAVSYHIYMLDVPRASKRILGLG